MTQEKKRDGLFIFWKGAAPEERRRKVIWTAFFVLVFCAQVWPLYLVGNRVKPMVLGMPFSMFWIALWIVISFFGLVIMNKYEK